jgi:carbon monoxide dehydrogenase subunit G
VQPVALGRPARPLRSFARPSPSDPDHVPSYQQSILIAQPPPAVYAYMDDISREQEWQSHLVEASQTPPGPTRVGSHRRYVSEFMGKRLVNTYVVKELDPGSRVVCQSTSDSAISATSVLSWTAEGSGTRVSMALEGEAGGALRFVPGRMIEAAFRKEVDSALAQLKSLLEAAD